MTPLLQGKPRLWPVPRLVGPILALLLVLAAIGSPRTAWGATAKPAAASTPGWPGGVKAYAGRYKLARSSDTSLATSGMLTVFGRTVPHQKFPQISGILSLYTTHGTNVLYLTHFTHKGTNLSARVNLGIYTGPMIGALRVVSHQGAALVLNFVPLSGTSIELHFTRISVNPHP